MTELSEQNHVNLTAQCNHQTLSHSGHWVQSCTTCGQLTLPFPEHTDGADS